MKKPCCFKAMAVLIIILICFCSSAYAANTKPKNVILLIGDGMGPNQVAMARQSKGSALNMESMQYKGTFSTANVDGGVTDSAAAGTALACGIKTKNGMVGMNAAKNTLPNIREYFADLGKKTGLVSTATITDATPAAFGAHVENRSSQNIIAIQFIKNNIDLIMGGGAKYFSSDLLELATEKGYTHITTKQQLLSTNSSKILGLFCEGGFPLYHNNGYTADMPTLEQMTSKSIEILNRSTKGFFLMVEGAAIDSTGHSNLIDENITETLEFDKAVKIALDFAARDGNTLVIVTADHETGGLKFNAEEKSFYFTSAGHTSANVPIFASGTGASKFTGDMKNTDLSFKIMELYNSDSVSSAPTASKSQSSSSISSSKTQSKSVASKSSILSSESQQSEYSSTTKSEAEHSDTSIGEGSLPTSKPDGGNRAAMIILITAGAVIVLGAGSFAVYKLVIKR